MLNSPIELSGLNLWLHGDAGLNVSVGTGQVVNWQCQSGLTRVFAPAGSGSSPLYIDGCLNGRRVVRFMGGPNDGTANVLRCTFDRTLPQTTLIVAKFNNVGIATGKFLVDGGGFNGANLQQALLSGDKKLNIENNVSSGPLDLEQWHIYAVIFDETMGHLYVDGFGHCALGAARGAASAMSLGARCDDNAEAALCDIAEVISYDGDKRADLPALHEYLIVKYDL